MTWIVLNPQLCCEKGVMGLWLNGRESVPATVIGIDVRITTTEDASRYSRD